MAKIMDSETGNSQVSESEDGMLILNPDEESGDTTKVYGSSTRLERSKTLALEDRIHSSCDNPRSRPNYNFSHGSGRWWNKDQWVETQAEVLEKYPGYDWVEYEDCYTDDWGDEYYEYWYELDCWTDLDVSYSMLTIPPTPQRFDHFPITTYQDYQRGSGR